MPFLSPLGHFAYSAIGSLPLERFPALVSAEAEIDTNRPLRCRLLFAAYMHAACLLPFASVPSDCPVLATVTVCLLAAPQLPAGYR